MPEESLSYRKEQVAAIMRHLRFGDSVSVVGVSGVGKSNLFRCLQRPQVREAVFQEHWNNYLIAGFDSNALGQITERAAYDLLFESLIAESKRAGVAAELIAQLDELHGEIENDGDGKRTFVQAMRLLLSSTLRQVAILFDQFDQAYEQLPSYFFAHLRFVRDEFKHRVSYVTFTREELHRLCLAKECEEFYELSALNVIALGPYDATDAQALLNNFVERREQDWSETNRRTLLELTGCHPGILKATIMALLGGSFELAELEQISSKEFLLNRGINHECEKIYESLSKEEKAGLRLYASGNFADVDPEVVDRLTFKRLIARQRIALGPLFTEYVTNFAARTNAATKMQAGPVRIDTAGEVWVNREILQPTLTKKELLLLTYFCLEPGRLRSKDEIISNVYASEYAAGNSVSDEALNALVRRLRERIEPLAGSRCRIATIRGKGYRFEIRSEA